MKLTVRGLLTFLFILIVGLWFALRVYQTRALDEIRESVAFLTSEADRDLEEVSELETALEGYHALWGLAWQNPKPTQLRNLEINRKRFSEILVKIHPVRLPGAESDLDSLSKLYFEATQSALDESMLGKTQKARIEQLYVQLLIEVNDVEEVYGNARRKIATTGKQLVDAQRDRDIFFLAVSVGGLAVLAAAIWILLGAPLTELARGMRRLSKEIWDEPLKVKGFGEIAALIRSFNAMAETIKRQKEMLVTEATTDELTGLLNFRAFQDRMQEELERAKRMNEPLSLILADIDYFKKFNDTRGHMAGNEALKEIAAKLRKGSRRYDIVARFGGEEFAVVMPETDGTKATVLAERIRKLVASNGSQLTISCGVASYPAEAADLEELIAKADKKLYRAKAEGRNRIVA
ncbi:MAG TPA: GGDEF domain-containing protein [bacterium]|nr:GGDEF domain-containing protein [bacterium]